MPFTNTIVTFINDYLKDKALNKSILQPVQFYNVASQVSQKDQPATMFPGVINIDGEIEAVQPDDIYNISIYHKVISNTYTAVKKSYGNENDIQSLTEMQLFVFAQSDKIKMTAESLEPFIVFGLPGSIETDLAADLRIKSCLITPLSSDMDKIRNFKNEFPGFKFFLKPEHIFFSVRYQIKKTFDRDCVDACT